MTHNWKPGDVALVEAGCHANRVVALRTGVPSNMGWACCDSHDGQSTWHWSSDDSGIVTPVRPLVVIDPEDREQIERLADVFCHAPSSGWVDQMQAALRSLLEPEPEEPTGLGAVVRAGDDSAWVRIPQHNYNNWRRADAPETRDYWRNIPRPITVLSEGWQESTDD